MTFLNGVKTNNHVDSKKTLFISIFITLIVGLGYQIVKYTGKHRYDIVHVL
jgi:hypothetical protein